MEDQPDFRDDQVQNELRFQRLEAGVTELQAQSVKFETWFAQMSDRSILVDAAAADQ